MINLSDYEIALVTGSNNTYYVTADPWTDPWDPTEPNDPWGTGGGGGGGRTEQEVRDAAIEERISIDASVPASKLARAQEAEKKLEAAMKEISEKIHSLSDSASVSVNGKVVSGAEAKEIFDRLSFVITDGHEAEYGRGGGANVDGVVGIDLEFLEYVQNNDYEWGAGGSNWLILHELGHETEIAEAVEAALWQQYLDSDSTPTFDEWQQSTMWRDNEIFTDEIVGAFATELDIITTPFVI